jgi:hypothetical protein
MVRIVNIIDDPGAGFDDTTFLEEGGRIYVAQLVESIQALRWQTDENQPPPVSDDTERHHRTTDSLRRDDEVS